MDPTTYAVIAAAVLLGSIVQSAVGLGVGLVAAPVTALLEPSLMPGALLMVAVLMPCLTLVFDHHDIDWPGLGLVAAGPGGRHRRRRVGGHALLATRARHRDRRRGPGRRAATWRASRCRSTGTLSVAGFASGITGTATSIGGPPIAIVYQHRPAREIRTTMAVYFLIGAALSLVALFVSGDLTPTRPSPRPSCCRSSSSVPSSVPSPGGHPLARRPAGRAAGQLGIGPRPARPVPDG